VVPLLQYNSKERRMPETQVDLTAKECVYAR
jgi:hypothetical protein